MSAIRAAVTTGETPTHADLLEMLYYMRLQRAVEDRGIKLYYQGKICGAYFTGWGHEATVVGATYALGPDDLIAPMHRDLAAYIMRGIPVRRVFAQFLDREGGLTRGRDGNVHMGDPGLGIFPFISHMAASVPVAAGMALACRQRGENRVVLTFFGDGATSTGAWHEGVNFAAVFRLPVVLVLENNQYAYSTPLERQTAAKSFVDKAPGYGIAGVAVDGNDVLEVFQAAREAVERARRGEGPTLIECRTMRVRGHSEADRYAYVPRELLEEWAARDPIVLFEQRLRDQEALAPEADRAMQERIAREVEDGTAWAEASPEPAPETVTDGVYARPQETPDEPPARAPRPATATVQMTYLEAVRDGLLHEMRRDPRVFVIGEDIGVYGGAFGITKGFLEEFGPLRAIDGPLAETASVGAGVGAAVLGMRPVVEMQFADFVTDAMTQVTQMAAKFHWRTGHPLPMVVRMPYGGDVKGGPFHSQCMEAWFVHTPGLKVVVPAFAADAKGLMIAAIRDPNPVMYFEHKHLYRYQKEDVPEGELVTPIGRARVVRDGTTLSVVSYGWMVHKCLMAAEEVAGEGIDAEIVDLRTLLPLDRDTILASVRKTNKALIVHEATLTGGIGGEIAAIIAGEAFDALDGPVVRLASQDTPVPHSPALEAVFQPRVDDIVKAIRTLAAY